MLDQAQHRTYMYQLIKEIFDSPLRQYLAFKGGTLCYFLKWLPRFSTDLDFDLIQDSPDIIPLLEKIVNKLGKVKDKHNKRFSYFILMDYGAHHHNIKIEISKKKYINNTYEQVNFFWTPIRAMANDAIFTNKLLALHTRYKNRDLFDVHFFFTNHYPINEALIKERTWWTYKDILLDIKKNLPKKYSPKTVLAEIGDLIDGKQKHFMKAKVIEETLGFIEFTLFNIDNPIKANKKP